jgi:HTH-type transcriptional regulator, glycine betaine synthesis regulator
MSGKAIMASEIAPSDTRELWRSEIVVSDVIGRLIEFWGFKRNMGRIWTVLYLSPDPLTAQQLRELLMLSAGAISMTLTDLLRWGVVRKVWIQGDRRDYFTAEVHMWRMISRVMGERERMEIVAAIEACQEAIRTLEDKVKTSDGNSRQRAEFQMKRVRSLLKLARLGKALLDGLLATAKIDAEQLAKFSLAAGEAGRASVSTEDQLGVED